MARPGQMLDPDRDRYWNPALPGMPRAPAPMPAAVAPAPRDTYGVQDVYGSAAPKANPRASLADLSRYGATVDPAQLRDNALSGGAAALDHAANAVETRARYLPEPAAEAPIYKPDAVDLIGAALRGFAGNHGPSAREVRWGQQVERQRENDATARLEQRNRSLDERNRALDAQRAKESDAKFGNWLTQAQMREQAMELRQRDQDLRERQLGAQDEHFGQGLERRDRGLDLKERSLRNQEDVGLAARKAAATADASTRARDAAHLPVQLEAENRAEIRAQHAADIAAEKIAKSQYPAQAAAYAKDTENDLRILSLVKDFNSKNPAGKAIKGTGPIQGWQPDWASDETALDNRGTLRLINETWARGQSGAAISMTEEERFNVQSGTNEKATDEQVRVAMRTLEGVLTRYARARAVGQEDAASEVANAWGVDLGLGARKTRAPAQRGRLGSGKAKPSGDLGFDPNDPLGGL